MHQVVMQRRLQRVELQLYLQAMLVLLPILGLHQVLGEVNGLILFCSFNEKCFSLFFFLWLFFFFSPCLCVFFLSIFCLRCVTHTCRQSTELPKKSAPIPGDATADPAERSPSSRPAARDRQGKSRAAAGDRTEPYVSKNNNVVGNMDVVKAFNIILI